MRGSKVKALRRQYSAWVKAIAPRIPDKMRAISFRVWRKRAVPK